MAAAAPAAPVVHRETLVSASELPAMPPETPEKVTTIEILHDGAFTGRSWETVTVRIVDENGNVVRAPQFDREVYMRTAFGDADFRPEILSPLDFTNGVASLSVLPRGKRTIVIQAMPSGTLSRPMEYEQ
jgi:hypothetical protein